MLGDEFLNYIWSLQPDGYRFVVLRKNGFQDHVLPPGKTVSISHRLLRNRDLEAIYFCPVVFSRSARRKQLALPSRLMYQDLDESDPRELPLAPELWWETSPGRYQAIWVLDQTVEPSELQSLNRALNRACHADPGTWNLTRLLRVPGSWNGKRGCRVTRAYGKSGGEELRAAA